MKCAADFERQGLLVGFPRQLRFENQGIFLIFSEAYTNEIHMPGKLATPGNENVCSTLA